MNFHGSGGPSRPHVPLFLGCLFQDRFLIVLGSVSGSIWAPFRGENRTQIGQYMKSNFGSIFGDPPLADGSLFPWPGAPWQPPSRARFSEQETIIWARNKINCSFLSPCLKLCSKKTISNDFSYCSFPLACDLTRSGPRPGEFSHRGQRLTNYRHHFGDERAYHRIWFGSPSHFSIM